MSDDAHRLNPLPALIFSSRWLQLPLYLGLIVAQGVYVFLFLKELSHLVMDATTLSEQQIMLLVLGLIDVVMISNLLMMVIVGGYETFVSRMRLERHPVAFAAAKDALAAGYAGVSCNKVTATGVMWQTIIHTIFILSALGIAWTDKVMSATPGKRAAH